jgi:hypothetical protein
MDRTMADSSSIGSLATIVVSLATLGFTRSNFVESNPHHQANMTYSGQAYFGYAAMAWLGVLFLAFGGQARYIQ